MILNQNTIIESVNPKLLSKIDLEKIVEIEQDMWSRESSIWEYVKCNNCWKIHSKEDIFWHISNEIKSLTVKKIESIIDFDIVCLECNDNVSYIYNRNDYIESIIDRYNNLESNLSICRNKKLEIIWFFDWYKSNFIDIFNREFSKYYSDIWINTIINILETNFWINLENDLFVSSSLWMEDEYKNLINTYNLMKNFYTNVFQKHWYIDWIYESKLWTNTHAIYEITWAKKIWISDDVNLFSKVKNINLNSVSDIFIHKKIAETSLKSMNLSAKDFIKKNRINIKEILNNYRYKSLLL